MNYLGIQPEQLTNTTKELNTLLASYHIYYQNLRNFHWNIEGENFFELHEKFEELYMDARDQIDQIAERVLTLRSHPLSRLSAYLATSKIPEANILSEDRAMVITLLENHKILIEQMRGILKVAGEAEDEGTIDLISSFLESLEKKSWMLDAWTTRKDVVMA
ncbi:MAG: DNA starvation/stationary phase protection protein [Bacteroidota bacterium]